MKTTVETLEGNKVKRLRRGRRDRVRDGDRRRVPAHRPGGAHPGVPPRQGAPPDPRGPPRHRGRPRGGAARTRCPSTTRRRCAEHDVDVIAPPEIDITAGEDDGAVVFDAVVEVRPEVTVAGYDEPAGRPSRRRRSTDEEVDAQIDRLRAELRRARGRRPARPATATTSPSTSPGSDGRRARRRPHRRRLPLRGRRRRRSSPRSTSSSAAPRSATSSSSTPSTPTPTSEAAPAPSHPGQGGQGEGAPRGRRRVGHRGLRVRDRRRAAGGPAQARLR